MIVALPIIVALGLGWGNIPRGLFFGRTAPKLLFPRGRRQTVGGVPTARHYSQTASGVALQEGQIFLGMFVRSLVRSLSEWADPKWRRIVETESTTIKIRD